MTTKSDQPKGQSVQDLGSHYSETVIDYVRNPRNVGILVHADGYATITGPCGDTMGMWLEVRDDRIWQATFWTDGCGTTVNTLKAAVRDCLSLRNEPWKKAYRRI